MQDMSSMQKQHGLKSIIINKNLKLVFTSRSKYLLITQCLVDALKITSNFKI